MQPTNLLLVLFDDAEANRVRWSLHSVCTLLRWLFHFASIRVLSKILADEKIADGWQRVFWGKKGGGIRWWKVGKVGKLRRFRRHMTTQFTY